MMKVAVALSVALAAGAANAAPPESFTLGPKSLSYGVGLRVGGGYTDAPAPGAAARGVATLGVRPYISGQITPWMKFSANPDLNNGDTRRIHVLDAVAQFPPTDPFTI